MSKFKVGDRVAAYGGVPHTEYVLNKALGEVTEVFPNSDPDGDIVVEFDNGDTWTLFSQQCRKLRPPKRPTIRATVSHQGFLGLFYNNDDFKHIPYGTALTFVLAQGCK